MEAYELDKIKVLATSFRGAIEIAKDAGEFDNDFAFPRFPKGCCGDTSDLLAEYLAQQDIYTYYVCGQKGTQSHADRKSTRLNSSHASKSRMPSSA